MITAFKMAKMFHECYERLAPQFGYETREETKVFDPESKNGRLMIAVCDEIGRTLYKEIETAVKNEFSTRHFGPLR